MEKEQDESIKLTRIAKNRLSSSKNPAMVLLFGSLRTGKSTTASYLYKGMNNTFRTAFKTAASSKACTQFIDSIGPIKLKDFAESLIYLMKYIIIKTLIEIFSL